MLRLIQLRLPLFVVVPVWLLTMGVGLGVGYGLAQQQPAACPEAPQVCDQFAIFWQAWDIASENFVNPQAVDPKRMTEGAIEGMLDSLGDRGHTRFLSAEAAGRWRESLSGSFEGIGATLDIRDDVPVIVSPIEGSPAEKAGLRSGDWLIKVNGVSTTGMTIEEVVTHVRGPAGTTVTLTIQHLGEQAPIEITVTRATIKVPSVTWRMLPGDIAFVHLNQFAQESAEDMEAALLQARNQGARAVILDLRDNPGGLVRAAVSIAGEFLPENSTVFLQSDRSGERSPYTTSGKGVAEELPLVVLVNGNTASAAEIVSGALQENQRARVIGVPTAGTGTVLNTFNLEDGSQMLLGTQQWLTPEGDLIKDLGITPDEVVQLDIGIQRLTPSEAADLPPGGLTETTDKQLARAVELIQAQASAQ